MEPLIPWQIKGGGTWNVIHDEDEDVIVRVGAGRIEHVYKWYACCMAFAFRVQKELMIKGEGGKSRERCPTGEASISALHSFDHRLTVLGACLVFMQERSQPSRSSGSASSCIGVINIIKCLNNILRWFLWNLLVSVGTNNKL